MMKTKKSNAPQRDYKDVVSEVYGKIDVKKLLDYYGIKYFPRRDEMTMSCIFHERLRGKADRHPSLSINVDSKLYNCLSCPAGGNVFQFIMQCEIVFGKRESCTFHSALLKACEIFNIQIDGLFNIDKDRPSETFDIEEINMPDEYQQEIFSNDFLKRFHLKTHHYFEGRGFKRSTLEEFEMGFGIKGKDVDRCVFPIRDVNKNLVGWTGRTIHAEQQPKWLHQPSDRFKKEYNLFNIDKALPYIMKENSVYVVESVANVMRMWESGRKNVVAILGNKLSDYQANMLCKYADTIYLLFDNDDGGYDGTSIAVDKLVCKGKDVYIGKYDFGMSNGKAIDIGDVDNSKIDTIKFISMYQYIEENIKDVKTLEEAGFSKEGTEVELSNGKAVLCVESLLSESELPQVTFDDFLYIERLDTLFGVLNINI